MLQDIRCHATLPATDIERAKAFYRDTLGLEPAGELAAWDRGGAVFFTAGGGTRFAIFPSPKPERGGHTQLGFAVNDIGAEVAALRERGVVFEEYDLPGLKTDNGIATTGDNRAAWFKDSEGNTVGLIEMADMSLR